MFIYDDKKPNEFTLMPGQADSTTKTLKPGVYNLDIKGGGMGPPIITFEKTVKYNKGMLIKGGVFSKARKATDKFVRKEMYAARDAMGMMHKIGVIFDGKPGTGKTFLAGQIAKEFAEEHNAVGIISTDHDMNYPRLIDSVREFDKDRLIVLVMDEFEKSAAKHRSSMLSFLDGTDSRDNVVVIATINDISSMPSYLKDRPGRFEDILKFKSDDPLVLKSIVTQCIPQEFKEDFSVDELIREFTNKANANKFGLKNENDDFTVDRLRVVIRDLIAEKIKEKEKGSITLDTKKQVELAAAAMKPVKGVVSEEDGELEMAMADFKEEVKLVMEEECCESA